MHALLKTILAVITMASFFGFFPSRASAASIDMKKPHVEAVTSLQSTLTPYLQLHYEAESMLMLGLRPARTRTFQANVIGLSCVSDSKGTRRG
jgi:hypothetical protein